MTPRSKHLRNTSKPRAPGFPWRGSNSHGADQAVVAYVDDVRQAAQRVHGVFPGCAQCTGPRQQAFFRIDVLGRQGRRAGDRVR